MSLPGNIVSRILAVAFQKLTYELLRITGWKQSTVFSNLEAARPWTPDAQTALLRQVNSKKFYRQILLNLSRHVADIVFEFGIYKSLPQSIEKYPCKIGSTLYELSDGSIPVIKNMREGGLFLTAHYGNYEAMGPWLCRLGIPLKASYIPLKPKWLNRLVEKKMRSVNGESYATRPKSPREFLRELDQGKLFCLLSDQDSRITSALEGTFLGKKVHVNPLPDFLLRHRPETRVFFCWLEERDKRKVLHAECVRRRVGARHEINKDSHDGIEKSIGEMFNRWLEERIAENPTLWYGWTHRRFYSCDAEMYDTSPLSRN